MKTVSLELAKALKDMGYPQKVGEKQFYWILPEFRIEDAGLRYANMPDYTTEYMKSVGMVFSAPTADEILDLLPDCIKEDGEFYFIVIIKTPTEYGVRYENSGKIDYIGTDGGGGILEDILADAAAKMWLYLKENDLLGVK